MDLATVRLLAKYNSHANVHMGRHIAELSPTDWNREFSGYYPSVHSLCSHVFIGDILWLHRLRAVIRFSRSDDPILARTYSFSDDPFSSMSDYADKRNVLDRVLLRLSEELTEDDMDKRLIFTNAKGETHDRPVGGCLLHLFNHQTHHRAMVSLYLEFLGKANDYSGLYQLT